MKRRLSHAETSEARLVFQGGLIYDKVGVFEGARWPNAIAKIGAAINREPATGNNAVTLGNQTFFPIQLHTSEEDLSLGRLGDMGWLIHELTHVWQFQHEGPSYLARALAVQIRLGPAAYEYGGETGLVEAHGSGRRWAEFNPEQQGDIVRDLYVAIKAGGDTSAWAPFLTDLRSPP